MRINLIKYLGIIWCLGLLVVVYPQDTPSSSLGELAAGLTSPALATRLETIVKIGQLNNLLAVKLLLTQAEDENPEIQSALVDALSNISDKDTLKWLNETGAFFPNQSIRILVITALGKIGAKTNTVVPALLQTLSDEDSSIRLATIQALVKIPSAFSYLTLALLDEEWSVRAAVIKTIGNYSTEESLELLLSDVNEPDLNVEWELEETINSQITRNPTLLEYLLTAPDTTTNPLALKTLTRNLYRLEPKVLDDYTNILVNNLSSASADIFNTSIWSCGQITKISGCPSQLKDKIINSLAGLLKSSEVSPENRLQIVLTLAGRDISLDETDWRIKSALIPLYQEGVGGVLPDLFINRVGENRQKALIQNGGSAQTEEAIQRGLEWLVRHQELDGRWICAKHNPLKGKTPLPDFTTEDEFVDASVTGLSILCFLGDGQTHTSGRYRDFIRKGLEYLINCQNESGLINFPKVHRHTSECLRFGPDHGKLPRRYNHNIGTMSLVEAYAMSGDKWLAPYAQKALDHARDYREAKYNWSFYLEPTDIGPSIYYIMSMMVAKQATDLKVYPSEIDGAKLYLDRLTQPSGRVYFLEGPAYCFGGYDSLATSLWARSLMRVLAPEKTFPATLDRQSVDLLSRHLPVWQPYRGGGTKTAAIGTPQKVIGTEDDIINQWYWCFATLSLLALSRSEEFEGMWSEWNKILQSVLLLHQRLGGDDDGSWDPVGAWGSVGGRMYSTTFGILTLQAYYSYKLPRSHIRSFWREEKGEGK